MKKKKTILFYIIVILFVDFIATSLIFKKTLFWDEVNNKYFPKKHWRIESNLFHHNLKKNINVQETWGHFKYKLVTNSLGFRDTKKREINLNNNKKKVIYINGDSFVEGVGYNYEDTLIGLLDKKLSHKYLILNSSVTSYSPSIYYKKTQHFINLGLKIDHCLIFLDISDIPDENFIEENEDGEIYDLRQEKTRKSIIKSNLYSFAKIYSNNFTSGKIISVLREIIGNYKSKLKKKFLASKKLNVSFFKITDEQINLYKSTHIDRSMWTFNKKYSDKWKNKGLAKASTYLGKLFELLNENHINSYLIIYPNPGQILLNDENVHEIYWKKWSSANNVNLINLYKYFNKISKEEIIKEYFIPGDVHWNKKGHYFVFKSLENEIFNDF